MMCDTVSAMANERLLVTSPRPKEEPRSAPGSPSAEGKEGAEKDSRDGLTPTQLPLTNNTAPTSPAHQDAPTPKPLDLSHRECGRGTKRAAVSGVTLFPGLTITPGGGTEEEALSDHHQEEDAPLTPSPTPSPPENSFPRFHFGRAGGTLAGAASSECPKPAASTTATSVTARSAKSPPGLPHAHALPDGEGMGGGEAWWYPGLIGMGGDIFRGLPDLPLPFPGLPAFCEYMEGPTAGSFSTLSFAFMNVSIPDSLPS